MVYRNTNKRDKLHAGLLRDRITIAEVTTKPDDKTGKTQDFYIKAECWAKVDFAQKDVDRFQHADQNFENNYIFTIRLGIDVTTKDYIRWRNEWYKVKSVARKSPYEDFLVVIALPSSPNWIRDYNLVDSEGVDIGDNDKTKVEYLWE